MLKLYKYQSDYLRDLPKNFLFDADTGTGKTVMALAHYRIHGDNKPLCIVAPASKLKEGGWQRMCEKMCPNKEILFISYHVLKKYVDKLNDYFLIYDECHNIKNSTGVFGKSAWQICKKAFGFILLSATPVPNGWEDAINYFKMFGKIANKTRFIQNFAITQRPYGYLEIVGWRNSKLLKETWNNISKRLNKEDCLELPPVTFKDVYFKPSQDYKKIFSTRVLGDKVFDNSMLLRHGLRQNCATKDKLEYLNDLVNSTKQNIVIFYSYESELYQLYRLFSNKIIFECNGKNKQFPTDNFSDVKNSVTLANYKSGSEGVEFTYADIIVYFSPSESYMEYYQSLGRCHRNGQTNKVTVYKFITKNTIEENIYQALDNKEDFNFSLWEVKYEKRNRK